MGYFLKKSNLIPYLEWLKNEKGLQIIVPVKNSNQAPCFEEYKEQELFLEEKTWFSAKKFFLPNKELEFLFEKKGKAIKIHETAQHRKKAIFGIRSCDLHALHVLDALFLEYYGFDRMYKNKREHAFTIGLECEYPCRNSFCTSMGTNKPDYFDLFFWEKKNGYFVEIGSERWEELFTKKFFEYTSEKKNREIKKSPITLQTKGLENLLEQNFEHKIWEKESERCLSCSSCTQVCPTCYCFETKDFFMLDNNAGRYREWDSCQLQQFTKIRGAIFRKARKARLRQFVMHKLSYYKQNHGLQLCVGCGRCINACPVKISLVEIAKAIQKKPLGEKNA